MAKSVEFFSVSDFDWFADTCYTFGISLYRISTKNPNLIRFWLQFKSNSCLKIVLNNWLPIELQSKSSLYFLQTTKGFKSASNRWRLTPFNSDIKAIVIVNLTIFEKRIDWKIITMLIMLLRSVNGVRSIRCDTHHLERTIFNWAFYPQNLKAQTEKAIYNIPADNKVISFAFN